MGVVSPFRNEIGILELNVSVNIILCLKYCDGCVIYTGVMYGYDSLISEINT